MDYFPRKNVLLVGTQIIESRPFEMRGLNLVKVQPEQVQNGLNDACAVIISEPVGRIGLVRQHLDKIRIPAVNCGLSVIGVAESTVHAKSLMQLWKEYRLSPERVYFTTNIENAAQFLNHFDAGPPVGNPTIFTTGKKISPDLGHLLKRAFQDCERIYLEPLGGGRASIGVYCVHAFLRRSEVALRPLPFFIKVDEPIRISKELSKYELYADFYIPFYLRPNIDKKRCVEIEELSALVGNFVEDSRSLRSVLRSNQGSGTIFSLFEHSLKGFRAQPANLSGHQKVKLASFVAERAWIEGFKGREIQKVVSTARDLGFTTSLKEIESQVLNALGDREVFINPYHGDLHAGNVMVRGKDAILIDFFNVDKGPTAADPAALEVSLIFGTDDADSEGQFKEWKSFVDEIYNAPMFHSPPGAEIRPNPFSWLRKAIRELRHIKLGCNCDNTEVAAIVFAYLMRFARLGNEMKGDEDSLVRLCLKRHAYALVVAERIAISLVAKEKKANG